MNKVSRLVMRSSCETNEIQTHQIYFEFPALRPSIPKAAAY